MIISMYAKGMTTRQISETIEDSDAENALEEDKQEAFKAGMNAHIAKPIDIKTILVVFNQVFGTTP